MPEVPLSTITVEEGAPNGGLWPDDFGLQVRFESGRAVVSVLGDVDIATAPTIRSMLANLVDQGAVDVTLDLNGVTFMSAAGLGVIASVAGRLTRARGALTLLAPTHGTRRLLEITGLAGRITIVTSDATEDLRANLARAAARPARNAVIDAELLIVVAVASATVEGADGVSVTLERQGRFTTVAASNPTVLEMDAHQYETGEGPCLSAATDGREFYIESLAEESRWPDFVPLAVGEGIASILSTPLTNAERSVGALNIYSNSSSAFGPRQKELATMFASQASRIVTDGSSDAADDQMGTRIAEALRSRAVLAQAQGVLMGRHHITADEAAAMLHRAARAADISVLDHATAILVTARVALGPLDRLGSG